MVRRPRPRRLLNRRWLAAGLALALTACFEVELTGRVEPSGRLHGTARVVVPIKLLLHDEIGPVLGGSRRNVVETWKHQGVHAEGIEPDRYTYAIDATRPADLGLPWWELEFERTGTEGFRYAHAVSLPPGTLAVLDEHLMGLLLPMTKVERLEHLPVSDVVADAMDDSRVVVELAFPGEVTATNGERLDGNRVRWTHTASELRAGERLVGRARGRVGWWPRLREAVLDWWAG